VKTRNVTLALPDDLFVRARVVAARQHSSVSRMIAEQLERLVEQEEGYLFAQQSCLAAIECGYDLGTGGAITWARESLHER
jgi:hypothetical protein